MPADDSGLLFSEAMIARLRHVASGGGEADDALNAQLPHAVPVVPTAEREATIRVRAEGAAWLTLKARVALPTARRWCREVASRVDEVSLGWPTS